MKANNNKKHITITTQEELAAVPKDFNSVLEFNLKKSTLVKMDCDEFKKLENIVVIHGKVEFQGSDYRLVVLNDSQVKARGKGVVWACNKCEVEAFDKSAVQGFDNAKIYQYSKDGIFDIYDNVTIIDCIEKSETITNEQHKENRGK